MAEIDEFRATRKAGILAEYAPSDAPATEEYSYDWRGMIWCIRCEDGRYVFDWRHPSNDDRATLAEAEAALLDEINAGF